MSWLSKTINRNVSAINDIIDKNTTATAIVAGAVLPGLGTAVIGTAGSAATVAPALGAAAGGGIIASNDEVRSKVADASPYVLGGVFTAVGLPEVGAAIGGIIKTANDYYKAVTAKLPDFNYDHLPAGFNYLWFFGIIIVGLLFII